MQRNTFTAPEANILIVDDDRVNLLVTKSILDRYGMKIVTAGSAQDCFKLVQTQHFDIILMDHLMPVMDGMEATRLLREKGLRSPIIALTANGNADAKDMYLASGFDGYLGKPMALAELEQVLLAFLPPERVVRPQQAVPPELAAHEAAPAQQDAALLNTAQHGHAAPPRTPQKDPRFSNKIVRTILDEGRKKLPRLEEYWKDKAWAKYAIEVHALKTTARYCGHEELYALAQEQEEAERRGDFAPLEAGFPRLQALYAELLRTMTSEPAHRGVQEIS